MSRLMAQAFPMVSLGMNLKKILAIIFFALMVTVLAIGPVSAQPGKIDINGEVMEIVGDTR